jgi:transformation/transcription domain-associated protein
VYKSIAGSKFDILHKELHPLLPVLLENLNRLLMSSHVGSNSFLKSLLIELALSIPVKLAVLLPHLHYLVRPILMALHSGAPDLVLQSLRLLEVSVENVSPQLLQPFMHHK